MSERRIPLHPKHPERTCWGCDLYCPAGDLRCGNGTIRTPHPMELFGEDWLDEAQPVGVVTMDSLRLNQAADESTGG